jgi:hypothetical protein
MARQTIQPVNLNALSAAGGTFPSALAGAGTVTPGFPASTTPVTNSNAWSVAVTITGGTLTSVNVGPAGSLVQVGTTAGIYFVPAGQQIAITYSVAPAWAWTAAGLDAAGTGANAFAAGWALTANGVMYQNSGFNWLWYYNGAQACTASILIGAKTGGDVFPFTQDQAVLNTNGYGWLGPYSPAKYNQQDSAQFASAPGGVIGAAGVGLTCIDFSNASTLSVRLYQTIPVN